MHTYIHTTYTHIWAVSLILLMREVNMLHISRLSQNNIVEMVKSMLLEKDMSKKF